LYVTNDLTPGQILQFTLPLTSTSTPTVTIANANTNNLIAVAVDPSGNVAAGDLSGHLTIYNVPITSSSTPAAAFNDGSSSSTGQLVYNSSGDLFAGSNGGPNVNLFIHPLTSASTPATVITGGGIASAFGATLDASGNLIVSNATTNSNLVVFAPPYTGAPTIVTPAVAGAPYRKIAISGTQLFVCNVSGTTGQIDVYNLPLTVSSAPVFSMTNVNVPEAVAFDNSGSLYVGNLSDHTIRVFTPPFSAGSVPSVTFTVPAPFSIFGIAIGK
jgi:hypothetical protein